MNTSNYSSKNTSAHNTYSVNMNSSIEIDMSHSIKSVSSSIKGIDLLVQRYRVCLNNNANALADNAFQKSLILYGQDQRLDYVYLPPCMYMIIAEADTETKFIIHRLYLPYKNGVRFATFLLNDEGDVIESVCYQRNSKYLHAFKVIRKHIAMNSYEAITEAA